MAALARSVKKKKVCTWMNMVIAFIVTKAIVKNAPLMVLARHAIMKTFTWMLVAIVVTLTTASNVG